MTRSLVTSLLAAEEYRVVMMNTKRAAERRERDAFQAKWGAFHRCTACLQIVTPLPLSPVPPYVALTLCCAAPVRMCKYEAPPPITESPDRLPDVR
jgi:hypothetical protein